MRLRTQLNLAFTTLLIVILTITGLVTYSLIMDMLIDKEETQLKQKGEILIDILNREYGSLQSVNEFQEFLNSQDGELILYNSQENTVLYSTMPVENTRRFYDKGYFSQYSGELWEGTSQKYVTARIIRQPNRSGVELILLTPIADLQEVQSSFFNRLLIVFIIGGVLAILLSYFLTNRLVKPLTMLKQELKKVERRRFDDLRRVEASGEIKEVEQSLFDMASELKNYMQSQQAFFQNASHELKTPLMTIQGYAEGIKEGVFEGKEREQGLETMVVEINRLKKIINEMIWLAKLESEELPYDAEWMDSNQLLNDVYHRMIPLAEKQGIRFELNQQDNFKWYVDREKFLQAVSNISVNAIRHANAKVSLELRDHQIIIEDDGDGIPEDLIPYIFNRFVRGKGGETGLGLAIARTIIEQSQGTINVDKSSLGGARFVIKLPQDKN